MSDAYEDIRRAMNLLSAQSYQPHVRVLSPKCGLHDQHEECRALAICGCECHLTDLK